MHFTAILAHLLPISVTYDFKVVILAMVVAIVGSGIGLGSVSFQEQPGWLSLATGGIFIGSGIVGMHFTAMSALRLAAVASYDLKLSILSGAAAIGASFLALWLTFQPRTQSGIPENLQKIGSATVMGTAIIGMHYIATAATHFRSAQSAVSKASVIDNSVLAVFIGTAVLLLLTLALLAAFFGRRVSAELARTEALRQSEERLEHLVKQRTQELEAEKVLSEAANAAKTQFLANMSHELRTPLTAIIGFSSVLLEQVFGPLNAKQERYVAETHKCGYQLLDLINDLLDLSKIEAGQKELTLVTVSVEDVCQACLSLVREQADGKGLQLSLVVEPDTKTCTADERRLQQILLNLVSNAVKFTDTGSVTLRVNKASGYIQFAVNDTGIGIAESDWETLFQPFQQVDGGLSRKYQGTGLGLAKARNLARLHGGDITLKSELGQGSCFTLLLPEQASDR